MRIQLADDEVLIGRSATLRTWFLETSKSKRYFSKFPQLVEALRLFLRVDEKEERKEISLWKKYGLSSPPWGTLTSEELRETMTGHWLVVNYLESHPDIAAKYKPGQNGEIKYLDVLALAEKERNELAQNQPT